MKANLKNKITKAKMLPVTSGYTNVMKLPIGVAVITHHQSIKQSLNYQSIEAGYTVTVTAPDDDKEIGKTIRRAEMLVEEAIEPKAREQAQLLGVMPLAPSKKGGK